MRACFTDRQAAGRALGRKLSEYVFDDPVVLALPRGGVPVAVEVARALRAPLDLVLVRKVGLPGQPELAVAAVVDGDNAEIVFNDEIMSDARLSETDVYRLARTELAEIERRRHAYLEGRRHPPLDGRTLIIVDDGIATGATIRAAIAALRRRRPKSLIIAVPVAAQEIVEALRGLVDNVICLETPDPFYAVGQHYRNFRQVGDEEVVGALREFECARGEARARTLEKDGDASQ